MTSHAVVDLQDVTFRRGGREIITGVDLTIAAGERWVLLGPNGAGKSTLLGFCGARLFPTSGSVFVLGHQLGRIELEALRRRIGHVDPRHSPAGPLTIREVVLSGLTGTTAVRHRWEPNREQLARTDELLELVGLGRRSGDQWPTLSQGERGRALIARALVTDPELLILDEPSTGLDVAARELLIDTVDRLHTRRPDLASVLVTHHLEEVPASTTHATLLAGGRIVKAGRAESVLTSDALSAVFQHPMRVSHDGGRWRARTDHGLTLVGRDDV